MIFLVNLNTREQLINLVFTLEKPANWQKLRMVKHVLPCFRKNLRESTNYHLWLGLLKTEYYLYFEKLMIFFLPYIAHIVDLFDKAFLSFYQSLWNIQSLNLFYFYLVWFFLFKGLNRWDLHILISTFISKYLRKDIWFNVSHFEGAVFFTLKLVDTPQASTYCRVKMIFYGVISPEYNQSYLPTKRRDMDFHLFPWILWASKSFFSSWGLQNELFI